MKSKNFKHFKLVADISLFLFLGLWILNKFEVLPALESFTEYSGLFVVLYFIAMHYYYEKYLVKQKDATIKELKSHINKLSQ